MMDFKQLVRVGFRRLGYEITKVQPPLREGHEIVKPVATLAPWLSDRDFLKTYEIAYPYTMVDKYRCWELWDLVGQTKDIPGDILEVGVWKGGSGGLMAKRLQLLGTGKSIMLADTFTGVPKVTGRDRRYRGGEHNNASPGQVMELFNKRLGLDNFAILKGVFPDETGEVISHKTFSLCHIDVDVYRSAKDVMEWVWPRMNLGGVVVYDDYGFTSCNGVTDYVNELKGKIGRIIIHNLNGHAVIIR